MSLPFRPLPTALTALVAVGVALLPPFGLEPAAQRTLCVLVVAAGLWMTEALPISVTALLIPVLGTLLGVCDVGKAFAGFGDPIVFLFFGTFLLTDAAERHGLTARLAGAVRGMRAVREHPGRLLWALGGLGIGISAWVNNTATAVMLIPLALTSEGLGSRRLTTSALLACSYAPSIGGIATPVGTAPNLIGLRLLEEFTGRRPSFGEWCLVFAPLAVIAGLLCTGVLAWRARGATPAATPPADGPAKSEAGARRPWSAAERTLMVVFVAVIALWITPGILAATSLADAAWVRAWRTRLPEPVVPLIGALVLFMLPRARGEGERLLDAGVLRRVDWGTLLLFGGGLSLGAMMFESGLARALGEAIFRAVPLAGLAGVVLAATVMAVTVSELTSNTASASLVVPVVLALAAAAGVDPVKPALAATIGCSFGFMLPVSTPPNALVYATGRLTIREMIGAGILLDLGAIALITAWVTLLG